MGKPCGKGAFKLGKTRATEVNKGNNLWQSDIWVKFKPGEIYDQHKGGYNKYIFQHSSAEYLS